LMGFSNLDVLAPEISRRMFDHCHKVKHLHVHIWTDDYWEFGRGWKLRVSRGQVEQYGPGR